MNTVLRSSKGRYDVDQTETDAGAKANIAWPCSLEVSPVKVVSVTVSTSCACAAPVVAMPPPHLAAWFDRNVPRATERTAAPASAKIPPPLALVATFLLSLHFLSLANAPLETKTPPPGEQQQVAGVFSAAVLAKLFC